MEKTFEWQGKEMQQMWFRGTHGDIGGQLRRGIDDRGLANIPLVWMLEKLEKRGIDLPHNWQERFPQNHNARTTGNWSGLGMLFWLRQRRHVGKCSSESLHFTARNK